MSEWWKSIQFREAPISIIDGDRGKNYPSKDELTAAGYCLFLNAGNVTKNGFRFDACSFISSEKDANLRKGKLTRHDVVLTTRGTVGNVAYYDESVPFENVRINSGMVILHAEQDQLDPKYLYTYMNSPAFRRQIDKLLTGSAQPQLPVSLIERLLIPLPPLPEQRAIAAILSTWDDAITLTSRLIDALKRRKQALMQRLLTGQTRFPEFAHSREYQETILGNIPADWRYVPIADVAEQVSERNAANAELPVLSCTKYDGLVDSLEYFGRQIFSDDLSTYKIVRHGVFAYATNHIEEGSIGYQNLYDAALISPMYTAFKTTEGVLDSYLYKLLKTELYRQIFEYSTNSSVNRRGSLRWTEFSQIQIPLPTIEEQQAISAVLDDAESEIKTYSEYLSKLQTQKRALMQRLLTGQVRVLP